MEQSIFYQLSLVLAIAAGIALLFRLLRQPMVIGYIATGFLVGPSVLNIIHHRDAFESFSQLGIALLLFMVGLGLDVAVIRNTRKPVLLTFLVRNVVVGGLGYLAASVLGFSPKESVILATALLFSSTIIVIKAMSDKKEQSRLYAQIVIGILLVEDIVATIALLLLSANSGGSTSPFDIGVLLVKGALIAAGLALVGTYIMPRLSKWFAANQELLHLFALAWAFGVASVSWWAGFSIEVGALFAGVALAHVPYAQEISSRLKPLRDFFIVLFFIGLGERLGLSSLASAVGPAVIFSLIILVLKPLLTISVLGLLGYTKQTGFKVGIHLSQLSEFSMVFVILAYSTGVVDDHVVVIMTLTALITIALSTYLMKYDDPLYRRFANQLSIFERGTTKKEVEALRHYPLVLLGYHKGGHEFVRTFRQMKKPYVVVDYDPAVIETLEHQGISHIYGDATDYELLDELGLHKSELIVSAIPDTNTNQLLANYLMHHNKDVIFVCHANTYDEAAELYAKGAAYVILPHFIGSEQINTFIRSHGSDKSAFAQYRKEHLAVLGASSPSS